MNIQKEKEELIEMFGIHFETLYHLPPLASRILGTLIIDCCRQGLTFEELVERIKVHFRNKKGTEVLTLGTIKIDLSKHIVLKNDEEVALTQREFELLTYLIQHKGKVCTRNQILKDVWEINFEYDTGVIDVFMNAIRKKLNLKKEEDYIKTIRGVGYIAND